MTTTRKHTAKSLANVTGAPIRLIRGVLRQLGGGPEAIDTLRDVVRGGADAGYGGFTYTRDTVAFFRRYRSEIVALARSMADDLGEDVSQMVAGFRCLNGAEDLPSINRCLYGGRLTREEDNVANALAWFALEEVARGTDVAD